MPNKLYKGLETYREDDQDIFFGRENEIELIADHLKLFRLTIFHGASGVGKSSILRAGVAAKLRQEARDNLQDEDYQASLIAVVVFPPLGESWLSEQNELGKRLKKQILADIQEIDPSILAPKENLPLIETLKEWTEKIGEGKDDGKLLIILDQFESFFLAYSQKKEEQNYYAQELAQVVNYFGLRVNFLISIRSSAFTQLEHFKAFIPNLMDKRIELKRLDRKSAEKAIRKPIDFYNQHSEKKLEIEDGLVEQVLKLVNAEEKNEFEAPYLQLIMQSLWTQEREDGSFKLQKQTLIDLSGEKERGIVEKHFKQQMDELNPQEWNIATRIFDYLVTPSGERIPQKAQDLSDYYRQKAQDLAKFHINERDSEPEEFPENSVKELLEKLSKDSFRILRASEGDRYEIYFNILAQVAADFLQIRRQIQNLAQEAEKAWRQDFALSQLEALRTAIKAGKALQEILKKDGDWLKNSDTIPVIRTLRYILENIREQRQFKHSTNSPIYGASISSDGKLLATASFDGIVCLWDLETIQEKPIKEFRDPSESVFNLAFSPDGKKLATASWNGTVILWDLEGNNSTPDMTLGKPGDKEISLVTFSPDGQKLATTSLDGKLHLWDLQQSPPQSQVILCENPVMPFAHSLNFVNQGEQLAIAFWDGSVYLWDWRRNEKYKLGETQSQLEVPQSQLIATVDLKGIVNLWDLTNLSEIKEKWQAHHALISYVSYDAIKHELDTVSWDGRVRRCQVEEKTWSEFLCNRNPIYRASFSPDRQKLVTVSTSTGAAHLWDLSNDYSSRLGREQLVVCEGHTNTVYCVTSSPDGKQFASASHDGTVRLWDWQGKPIGKPFTFESRVYRVSFSPDGQYLGVAPDAKGVAYLVDLKSDKKTEFKKHKNTVYCFNFNAKGDQIASASEDGTVVLWDLQGKPLHTLSPQSGTVYYVSFSPDDQKLAIACLNGKIFLQDLQSEKKVTCSGHANAVYCLSFSPDGNLLASASADGTARLWDLEGKEKEFQFKHESMVFWVSFSPDGERLATAGGDGKVCLWQVKDGRKLAEFKHHDGIVFSVCFSPDGKQIATASEDGTVKLRKIEDLDELLKRAGNWLGEDGANALLELWKKSYSP